MNGYLEAADVVYVLDDDAHVRQGLDNLLQSVGLRVITFASVKDFLGSERPLPAVLCLISDCRD